MESTSIDLVLTPISDKKAMELLSVSPEQLIVLKKANMLKLNVSLNFDGLESRQFPNFWDIVECECRIQLGLFSNCLNTDLLDDVLVETGNALEEITTVRWQDGLTEFNLHDRFAIDLASFSTRSDGSEHRFYRNLSHRSFIRILSILLDRRELLSERRKTNNILLTEES